MKCIYNFEECKLTMQKGYHLKAIDNQGQVKLLKEVVLIKDEMDVLKTIEGYRFEPNITLPLRIETMYIDSENCEVSVFDIETCLNIVLGALSFEREQEIFAGKAE
jgi:hypothetical protein